MERSTDANQAVHDNSVDQQVADNPSEARVSSGMEIDCSGDIRVLENERSGEDSDMGVELKGSGGGVKEGSEFGERNYRTESRDGSGGGNRGVEVKDRRGGGGELIERSKESGDRRQGVQKGSGVVSQYNSFMSEFDEYVAGGESEVMSMGMTRALKYGFKVGDMVWGKVKSHPWWPGHIYNEALASPSVQRARRYGHVLVAFFGDSSYGWFDPAELIPFDSNFAEKSRQTNSRTFVRAVEEAVDELSRRNGLGLTCNCRNINNFRPTTVQGYLYVDVPGYEPGGIYSVSQIQKERDNFMPSEALSFVKQLALAPDSGDEMDINFIKKKAVVYAFRRQVYEEFDEPYAQAFNLQIPRPSENRVKISDQCKRDVPRAPLSGPMVTAEILGGERGSTKAVKVKDHSKKDKYLLKRRDEGKDTKTHPISPGQSSPSVMTVHMEGSPAVAAGEYGLLKRIPDVSAKTATLAKDEQTRIDWKDSLPSQVEKNKDVLEERIGTTRPDVADRTLPALLKEDPSIAVTESAPQLLQQDAKAMISDIKKEGTMSRSHDLVEEPELKTERHGPGKPPEPSSSIQPQILDTKHDENHVSLTTDGVSKKGLKKTKVKRPFSEMGSEPSVMGDKKKKKRRKDSLEPGTSSKKHLTTGKVGSSIGKLGGKLGQSNLSPGEYSKVGKERKDDSVSGTVVTGNTELRLPQLLSDLHAFALDPFHGMDRNCSLAVRNFFIRFRSLVFQKSLVLSPPSQAESTEFQSSQAAASIRPTEDSSVDHRLLHSSKPAKSLDRSDDPTKAGRKRLPSDRQEEIASKKLKRMKDLKSLAAEKKASLKTHETQGVERKETQGPAPQKPLKADLTKGKETVVAPSPHKASRKDLTKKLDPPSEVVDPTMLVMKFPPQTSLPSVAELKARFARFGPLDYSALRVFWKSSTCRVVFKYKVHAQAALKYAVRNNNLFGNVNVRYFLRDVDASATEAPDASKGRVGEAAAVSESSRAKDPAIGQGPVSSILRQPIQQSAVQLKSCLKKPSGDEGGPGNGSNGGRGVPRVKFMLGGEESNRGEQVMGTNNDNINNASYTDGGASSVAMDINSKNFQMFISASSSHIIPPQMEKSTHNNLPDADVPPRNIPNINSSSAMFSTTGIDISQQMLSLLMRCNEVVTNVTGVLGYVPYHPL